MSLVSAPFLAFILLVTLIYYVIPGKVRHIWLLIVSIAFACFGGFYTIFFVALSAVTTYIGGKFAGAGRKPLARNISCIATVVFNLALLCLVKFYGVMDVIAEDLNSFFGMNEFMLYAVPIGMSFYTLQMTGYVLDCRWERISPEKSFIRYLLFATYFPYLTSGPMNTYADLSARLRSVSEVSFSITRLKEGAIRIAWGFLKKLVIAERAATVVNSVYGDHNTYTGVYVLLGVICFAIQLYADFSGCMDVVLGVSHLLGIDLPENFNSPYLARSIREYWQRWHSTLGSWLRDYLFYPLLKTSLFIKIGDKARKAFGKKKGKKVPVYLAMLVLWFAVGYWHGGVWKYIIGSGLLHCFYIVTGMMAEPLFEKIRKPLKADKAYFQVFRVLRTFILVLLGFVFFRSSNVPDAMDMFLAVGRSGGAAFDIQGIINMGMGLPDLIVLISGTALLAAVDIYKFRPDDNEEPKSVLALIDRGGVIAAWAVFVLLVIIVLVFGKYGLGYDSGAFIYARI
ncbi:MAG: hypothetical protein K5745_05450 [Saccharofermentans sp.]|nr:hypothetical protein [Saccharofermentans sp.]